MTGSWRVLQPADLVVRREDYSASPWRIIHTPTGKELHWEEEIIELESGPMMLRKPGYRTKTEAVDALTRYVDQQTVALAEIAHAAKAYLDTDGNLDTEAEAYARLIRLASRLEFP